MSPRSKKEFEKIRVLRKAQILEAALEVFAKEGYHHASISKITQVAGVSKGLVYNYFPSKEDLLKNVLIQGIEGLKESYIQTDDELDSPDELEIFIKGGLDIMRKESHFYKLYFTVFFQPDAQKIIAENYQEMFGGLLDDISCYFKAKGDPYPMEKATLLAAAMDGFGMYYLMNPELYNLEVFERILFDLFK
jgi:AcrR family transcriptional regulator